MPYCPVCGKEVSEDDEFCSKCRTPLKEPRLRPVRRREEKDEKDEKGEKHEDDQAGAITGGLVVVWLGVSFALRNMGYYPWADMGGVFLLGIGVILILRGLWQYSRSGVLDHGFGYIVGGAFVAFLGANIVFDIRDTWAFFVIGLGLVIVLRALMARGSNPAP
jgi:hypothetical protein